MLVLTFQHSVACLSHPDSTLFIEPIVVHVAMFPNGPPTFSL